MNTATLFAPDSVAISSRLALSRDRNRFVSRRFQNDALTYLRAHERRRLAGQSPEHYLATLSAHAYEGLRFELEVGVPALYEMAHREVLGSQSFPSVRGWHDSLTEVGYVSPVESSLVAGTLLLATPLVAAYGMFVPRPVSAYTEASPPQNPSEELVTYHGLGALYAAQQLSVVAGAGMNPHMIVGRSASGPHRLSASSVDAVVLDAHCDHTPFLAKLFGRLGIPVLRAAA